MTVARILYLIAQIKFSFGQETQFAMDEHHEMLERHSGLLSEMRRAKKRVLRINRRICNDKHECYMSPTQRASLRRRVIGGLRSRELILEEVAEDVENSVKELEEKYENIKVILSV